MKAAISRLHECDGHCWCAAGTRDLLAVPLNVLCRCKDDTAGSGTQTLRLSNLEMHGGATLVGEESMGTRTEGVYGGENEGTR